MEIIKCSRFEIQKYKKVKIETYNLAEEEIEIDVWKFGCN
jgi:hypothetical protein